MSREGTGREEGFLARWSKRKRAGDAEAAAASLPAVVEGAPAAPPAVEPEPEFDLSSLPSLGDLTGTSDISVFLQKGVPEALKNAALRKAWVLDPMIKDHIEPVECGWDFNDPTSMAGFGPLDADTDAAAMLRQIMGEKEPAAAGAEAGKPGDGIEGDLGVTEAKKADPADQGLMAGDVEEGRIEIADSEEQLAMQPDDVPLVVSPGNRDDLPGSGGEIRPPSHKRRHGGAVPG